MAGSMVLEHAYERAGVILPGLPVLPPGVERYPVPGGGSRAVPIATGDDAAGEGVSKPAGDAPAKSEKADAPKADEPKAEEAATSSD